MLVQGYTTSWNAEPAILPQGRIVETQSCKGRFQSWLCRRGVPSTGGFTSLRLDVLIYQWGS